VPPAVSSYFGTTARRGGTGTAAAAAAAATAKLYGGVTSTLSAVRDRSNVSERSTSTAKGDTRSALAKT
jgi:hypothetical protein